MRALVATITAVALLASAPLANAADSVTTPVPGWCSAPPEVALFELTDHVSDAQCTSDASVRVDPRLVAMVTEKLVYVGPREMGKPSGKEREIVFAWLPTPITDPDNPGQVVFAMNQYQSYRDLKAANGAWMNTVSAVGEKVGEHAAERIFLIGPKWMKSGIAAGAKTAVDLAGAVAFQAPFAIMAPFTAGVSLMPSTAMYAESLFMAPTGTAHGASELVDGLKARNFEQALEGGAEFCGNVGIVLLAAAPVMEGGNALVPSSRAPISLFGKDGVPKLSTPAPAVRASVSEGKFGYLFGKAGGNQHNIERAAENAAQLNHVGVRNDAPGRALLQRHFDDTVADPTNITSTYTNEWGTFQTRESLLIAPEGFLKLETTWQVMNEGELRMVTAIPFGGS